MGVIVECGGLEVWAPSGRVGRLFAEQIRALEPVVGQPSGVEFSAADTLEIEAPTFDGFVRVALQTLETTNNGPLFAMAAGCVEVAVALNARITGQWPDVSDRLRPLVTHAQTVLQAISPDGTLPFHVLAAG
jgi:hypothetical protein